MILILDNYDSFTYNLYQQIEKSGAKTCVIKSDKVSVKCIEKLKPKSIVISPGPGRPENSGKAMQIIQHFYKKIPILGVCLGHQCIGQIFGAKVVQAQKIFHGKTSNIEHNDNGIFKNVKNPFVAARYHSLVIDKVPNNFIKTAWSNDGEIMAIKHNIYPLTGIQFHPESFMTIEGDKLIKNFINESKD
ncbi:aminodeoxychorismate/anthranilate synthase component II [Candidatus Peregrinibacteria bacterium]|nr:aminodeoxychorismate/anthranilate synthase component II [Candidatus Peregrinibacteria bacterium]